MLSRPVRADMKKPGVDFRKLKTGDRMTVYVVLPSSTSKRIASGCGW
jgi:hypothetical protein